MQKPKPKTVRLLGWAECTRFIERKYKIDTGDYNHAHTQFGEWCDGKGYGQIDPDGKDRGGSTIWCAEFQREVSCGLVKKRPFRNFWHWLIDAMAVENGGTIKLSKDLGAGAEPWIREILGLYLKEFGPGPYLTEW